MEAKINYQEAYVNRLYLNMDFEYNNTKYSASCNYINGCNLEDIEVLEHDTDNEIMDEKINKIAKDLFEAMDIEKHITF